MSTGESNQDALQPDRGGSRRDDPEEPLWEGGFASKAMLGGWVFCGIVTIALPIGLLFLPSLSENSFVWMGVVGAIALLWLYNLLLLGYRRLAIHYKLTTQRLIHEHGILKRVTDRIEMIDVDDVRMEQGLIERFIGTGTIRIASSDRSDPELFLRGIDGAREVAEKIDGARRKERIRRGLHIEAV